MSTITINPKMMPPENNAGAGFHAVVTGYMPKNPTMEIHMLYNEHKGADFLPDEQIIAEARRRCGRSDADIKVVRKYWNQSADILL